MVVWLAEKAHCPGWTRNPLTLGVPQLWVRGLGGFWKQGLGLASQVDRGSRFTVPRVDAPAKADW